ncbi:hypothetical protein [Streptomyces canus]|uniref:Uncharacterized protein n=1 Tax=Streptomyces canus TaxID=58343 RepID=A0AAW8FUV8_9ACTN|nr:hypothetical protein [Streptomyces canus]MDQ0757737.1 hypothetical protein [Streptomyces canus]MDQ0913669.1 hypothetical protein [Streptomyces canus]
MDRREAGALLRLPLCTAVLPLESVELDAFRRRHRRDTFWCGLLIKGAACS